LTHPDGLPSFDLRRRLTNWRTVGSIVLGVVLLVFLFRVLLQVDLAATWSLISGANPVMLAGAFVAYYLTFPLRALRWRYILSRAGTPVARIDATEIFCVSWYVNCIVPARLGDVYRTYLLRDHNGAAVSRTFGTLFIERAADIGGVFILAMAAGFWSFRGRIGPELEALMLIGLGVAIVLTILVVGLRVGGKYVARILPSGGARLWNRFYQGSTASLTPTGVVVIGMFTAVAWALEGIRLYLVVGALALPEIGIGISAALFVALIAMLFSIIPLTPAGVGFVEGGLIYALTLYGVPTGAAVAAAVTDRSITLVSVILIGTVVYVASPKVRRGFSGEPAPP
jgi:glycosyltransferase 2 family protein